MRPKRKNSSNILADYAYDLGTLTPAGAVISSASKAYKKHVATRRVKNALSPSEAREFQDSKRREEAAWRSIRRTLKRRAKLDKISAKHLAEMKKSNPAKFDRCVKAVKKRGGAHNAYAVCKAATSKGNKGKIQRYLLNTGKRKNPEDTAAIRYEYFHGKKPDEDIDVRYTMHEHTVLSGIGKLMKLEILAINGNRKVSLEGFKGALLAQDEKGKQLYIVGGDQSVNLKDFGITQSHELEILGALTCVIYFTTKKHLTPATGGTANYDHKFGNGARTYRFGQRGTRFPLVGYDVRNKLLSIQGGGYELPSEGIDG
jgi:hypothetical protein